jgi:ADP-ribosylation factor-like protein 3
MLRTIRNRAKRETVPRILILGLDNAGKTTILRALSEEDPMAEQGPTQGFNLRSLALNGRTANFCDLGGQRTLREYWTDYYGATDCLIFVVDSTDGRRMEEAQRAFLEVVENLPVAPLLVFANKQDLATAKPASSIAELLNLTEQRQRKWHIQGCSAKTGEGVKEGLEWLMANC